MVAKGQEHQGIKFCINEARRHACEERFMIHFCGTHKLQTKPKWKSYLSIHMNNHIAHLTTLVSDLGLS